MVIVEKSMVIVSESIFIVGICRVIVDKRRDIFTIFILIVAKSRRIIKDCMRIFMNCSFIFIVCIMIVWVFMMIFSNYTMNIS